MIINIMGYGSYSVCFDYDTGLDIRAERYGNEVHDVHEVYKLIKDAKLNTETFESYGFYNKNVHLYHSKKIDGILYEMIYLLNEHGGTRRLDGFARGGHKMQKFLDDFCTKNFTVKEYIPEKQREFIDEPSDTPYKRFYNYKKNSLHV